MQGRRAVPAFVRAYLSQTMSVRVSGCSERASEADADGRNCMCNFANERGARLGARAVCMVDGERERERERRGYSCMQVKIRMLGEPGVHFDL